MKRQCFLLDCRVGYYNESKNVMRPFSISQRTVQLKNGDFDFVFEFSLSIRTLVNYDTPHPILFRYCNAPRTSKGAAFVQLRLLTGFWWLYLRENNVDEYVAGLISNLSQKLRCIEKIAAGKGALVFGGPVWSARSCNSPVEILATYVSWADGCSQWNQ